MVYKVKNHYNQAVYDRMKIWLKGYFHAHVSAQKNLHLSEFHLINHANPLWPKLGDGKCGFLEVRAPRKAGETTSE